MTPIRVEILAGCDGVPVSICRVLTEHGIQIAPSTFYETIKRPISQRAHADKALKAEILRVYQDNYRVYGARKIWVQLNREGISIARCTVERLRKTLGIQGIRRGKRYVLPNQITPHHELLI